MDRRTLDEEIAMRGAVARDWAVQNQITLGRKAPRQKAWLVERHIEILRQGLHRTEARMKQESLVSSFAIVLSIATFTRNARIVINKGTPYQVLFGRQLSLLPPLEGGYMQEADGQCAVRGRGGQPRNQLHDPSAEGMRDLDWR